MQSFKMFLVSIGLMFVSLETNAQFVNGDFSSGTSSWNWAQTSNSGGTCASVNSFIPTVNSDTPYKFSGYGRSAKADGNLNTAEFHTYFCRQLSQQIYVPIGSSLNFDFWTNARRSSGGFSSYYSDAVIVITLKDIASNYQRSYEVIKPYCSPYDACATPVRIGMALDSALWGKTVILSINTTTEYRKGTSGGGYLYGASVYLDNLTLDKPGIVNGPLKSGAWYNSSRSGHGFHISKAPDGRYQLIWYTYLSNGKPIWYISDVAPMVNGVITSKIYKSTWNYTTQSNTLTAVGDIKLERHYSNQFTMYWDLYSVNGDGVGYDGGEPMSFLVGEGSYTGLWYEPALSGYGYSIDYRNSDSYTAVTAFYFINGEPVWARGEKVSAPTEGNIYPMTAFNGIGLCPECNGQPITKTSTPVGEVGMSLDVNKSWIYMQDSVGNTVWQRGLPSQPVDTYRLTIP